MNYAIWVTTKCNMSCIYCYEGKEKENLVLSKEKADQIINYILENKQKIKSLGQKGRIYLEQNLTKDVSINKYKEQILMTDIR